MFQEIIHPIKGFNPHTFIDWEGKIACVIYLPGCNFKCPFCHSSDLVLNPETLESVDYTYIKSFFKEKKGWIDGVVIGGGEPTLYKHLATLAEDIKNRGLLVKLDTNGTNPEVLKDLIDKKLVDYIAMDVKAPLNTQMYSKVTGSNVDVVNIKQSIDIISNSGVDYEFRTTVVPLFLTRTDIVNIAQMLKGAKRYILQQFAPKDTLDKSMAEVKPYKPDELKQLAQLGSEFVKHCFVRGI